MDYSNLKRLVHDDELIDLLYLNVNFEDLTGRLLKDNFLVIDESINVPFFAKTRDYVGARVKEAKNDFWIVRPISDSQVSSTEMATICFFLDFYTHTLSAPFVLTRINGLLYKATKLIKRSEQLSGANYMERKRMKEQLLLDIVNRWIYFDEDRNPNNYMIIYNSRNEEIIVAIDFGNVDLLSDEMKIEGTEKSFGWERREKTRYLTPLKVANFVEYDMKFFDTRFKYFRKIDRDLLQNLCSTVLRHNPNADLLSETITENILRRVGYVYDYFNTHLSRKPRERKNEKYRSFGKTFSKLYVDE